MDGDIEMYREKARERRRKQGWFWHETKKSNTTFSRIYFAKVTKFREMKIQAEKDERINFRDWKK